MNDKTKDSVFSLFLILVGGYTIFEGMNIVRRASKPPYNVEDFSISPGMLPVVLGCGLVLFSFLLLLKSLKGEANPVAALSGRVKAAAAGFAGALGGADVRSMLAGVVIMGLYTFFLLGRVPFWIGAGAYLVALMLFLRASKAWVILLSSAVSIALIVVLFEGFFKTTLP